MSGIDPDAPSAPSDYSGGGGGGLLGAGLQLAGAIYSGYVAKRNTDKTNEANKAMQEYGYQQDREMWNLQNQYNSPAAQMARLKEAGINPMAPFASGGGSNTGNSTTLPKYNAPTMQYNYQPMVDLPAALGAYQNFSMRQAQINNVKAQTDNIQQRTISEGSRNTLIGLQGKLAGQTLSFKDLTNPYQASILKEGTEKAKASSLNEWKKFTLMNEQEKMMALQQMYLKGNISQQQTDQDLKNAQLLKLNYGNDLMKMGINPNDHLGLRILSRILNEAGFEPSTFFKK